MLTMVLNQESIITCTGFAAVTKSPWLYQRAHGCVITTGCHAGLLYYALNAEVPWRRRARGVAGGGAPSCRAACSESSLG
jgi:hypothetical protein